MPIRTMMFVFSIAAFSLQAAHAVDRVPPGLPGLNQLVQATGTTPDSWPTKPGTLLEEQKWNQVGFGQTRIENLDVKIYTHEFDLSLVIFRDTGWTKKEVLTRMQRVAEIYTQCNIQLKSIKLVVTNAPRGWIDIDTDPKGENRDIRMAAVTPDISTLKPIIYFIRSIADESTGLAQIDDGRLPPSHPLTNTIWMPHEVTTEEYKNRRDSRYSPIAHEVAHILCRCGHIPGDEDNILSQYYDAANAQITPEQCEQFKSSRFVRPIQNPKPD